MSAIARGKEPEPVVSIEDIAINNPDKSKWDGFCGKDEKKNEDFPIGEIYEKDGELYAKAAYREDEIEDCRRYPIGENTFGRKGVFLKLEFSDGCLVINGETTCKKL